MLLLLPAEKLAYLVFENIMVATDLAHQGR
jgi:hypothetical protein